MTQKKKQGHRYYSNEDVWKMDEIMKIFPLYGRIKYAFGRIRRNRFLIFSTFTGQIWQLFNSAVLLS